MTRKGTYGWLPEVCRIVVGAVFVFSGVAKGIDPWGTALKVQEYLTAFGLEALAGWSTALAVAQCVAETALGGMLLCRVRMKLTALLMLVLMGFFTLLTLVIAIWNPLDDCGCFGSALKIDNWTTFAKNVVLLAATIVVWRTWRREHFFFPFSVAYDLKRHMLFDAQAQDAEQALSVDTAAARRQRDVALFKLDRRFGHGSRRPQMDSDRIFHVYFPAYHIHHPNFSCIY